jgi:predicted 2-oxoglutarate/Fe(II)-dependent dioxygenase YbiX
MPRRTQITPHVFTLPGVLDSSECEAMIARAESGGFEIAPINSAGGARVVRDTRNNDRVMIDDEGLATKLWERVRDEAPVMLEGRQARGLNERFRFYRYTRGQKFDWHSDGSFERRNGERSFLTFMVYLNEGYSGGDTRFQDCLVAGKIGMALVFEHGLIHQGAEITDGVKYVLRSDVMYGPIGQFRG